MNPLSLLPAQARLLARLRRQERQAFEEVVAARYTGVYRQLWHLTGGDEELAADLTQETFVQAWQSLPGFDGRAAIGTWLHTIAVRVWYRRLRGERRAPQEMPLADALVGALADNGADPAPAAGRTAANAALAAAVNALPPAYRDAVWLFYRDELKYHEIAAREQVPIGTVKSRLHAALRLLRKRLAPRQEELL